jgi:hypothetical protein
MSVRPDVRLLGAPQNPRVMTIDQRESVGTREELFGRIGVWGGVLGAVLGLAVAVTDLAVGDAGADRFSYPFSPGFFTVAQLVIAAQHVMILLGVLALASVVRPSRAGRAGLLVGVAGLVLLTVMELVAISAADLAVADPSAELVDSLYGIPTLVTATGLVVGGFAIARSGVLVGWRRWIVLVTGAFVVVLIPALMGPEVLAHLAIAVWMLLFAALAAAVGDGRARAV